MRLIVLLMIALACIGFVSADSGIKVNTVEQHDDILRLSFVNEDNDYIFNARVKAVIPELGIIFPARNINLEEDVDTGMLMLLEEDIADGEYLVRISIKKGSIRTVVHRYVSFR